LKEESAKLIALYKELQQDRTENLSPRVG